MISLSSKLAELEVARDVKRRELDVLTARLGPAKATRSTLEELWGAEGGAPLSRRPLVAALVSVLSMNFALFCGFILYLSRWSIFFWDAAFVGSLLLGGAVLPFARGAGAGARARRGLAMVTVVFLVLALIEAVAGLAQPARY